MNSNDDVSQNIKTSSVTDQPKEKIELFFTLTDSNCAPNRNYALAAEILTKKSSEKLSLGKTNQKNGGSKIDFDKTFVIDYYFEMKQTLNIKILQDDQPFAEVETTVGKIMGSKNKGVNLSYSTTGSLRVQGTPKVAVADNKNFVMSLKVNFGSSNIKPYFLIKRNLSSKQNEFNWDCVYKSEVLENPNLNTYLPKALTTQFLCNGNIDSQPIQIEFYDKNSKNPIGGICNTLSKLVEMNGKNVFLTSPTGTVLDNKVVILDTKFTKHYSFLDYINEGTQISTMVAIDFTASNGHPNEEDSLHSVKKNPNLYEMALYSCCSILSNYDHDQLYPVFGYGAKIGNMPTAHHCFPVNMTEDVNISKVEGILEAYRKLIQNPSIKFYGPTHFSPIIKTCTQLAKNVKNFRTYSILTILTDGLMNDWDDSVDAIVEAAKHPLSIIIIGIGKDSDEGFPEMRLLDSDHNKLVNSNGEKAIRDVVQFVEFEKLKNDPKILSEKVLEEIPHQLEEFFRIKGIAPGGKNI